MFLVLINILIFRFSRLKMLTFSLPKVFHHKVCSLLFNQLICMIQNFEWVHLSVLLLKVSDLIFSSINLSELIYLLERKNWMNFCMNVYDIIRIFLKKQKNFLIKHDLYKNFYVFDLKKCIFNSYLVKNDIFFSDKFL